MFRDLMTIPASVEHELKSTWLTNNHRNPIRLN